MIHSASVQTHQEEASHARVLLDTLGMELQERVLVSKTQVLHSESRGSTLSAA